MTEAVAANLTILKSPTVLRQTDGKLWSWEGCGDTEWLRGLWPKVKRSLDYCIETWDPGHKGVVEEPHHNTYDIEFLGPDGMCTSFYLGALQAAVIIGKVLERRAHVPGPLQRAGRATRSTNTNAATGMRGPCPLMRSCSG